MNDANFVQIERNIARCRLLLSVAGPLTVYLDPSQPTLLPSITGAAFFIHPHALAVLVAHIVYSLGVYVALRTKLVRPQRITLFCTWADVLFGAAIALVTEGTNSPFYIYFAFAVTAAGLRGSFRTALTVTAASVGLYLAIILISRPEGVEFYVVRGVSLAITGYLVGFLGRQRVVLETNLIGLARSLHDGYAQALAGVNLRIETCRELLRRGQHDDAYTELGELQVGVRLEYDDLRAFVRSLLGLDATTVPPTPNTSTRFAVRAEFSGSLVVVEHALQIMLEGVRNIGRHSHAPSATIIASPIDGTLTIRMDDDGVGFPPDAALPWSIASRATELGGVASIERNGPIGGRIVVQLPNG
ncbi:MAG TPA: histidine kinase [Candidatus Binatia bacterium]|jgi:signal transduction histidine kinase|nr:histidine kinase [Candidatus Binatia bacterium]